MVRGERVIAISEFIRNYIKQYYETPDEKITVIPRGVDLEYFNPGSVHAPRLANVEKLLKPHKDYAVIFVPGRITSWKGQDFVLRALAKLPTREYTCVFSGKKKKYSGYADRLYKIKSEHNLRGNVSIIDAVEDMPAAYKRADIVISPAQKPEAFGRIAAEAQAVGTIVIATDHGGSCEVVVDGETGFLVPHNDEVKLSDAIQKALKMTTTERNALARKSREHIEQNFSLEQMISKTIGVYREVLGESGIQE